jgi:hypothetical protein
MKIARQDELNYPEKSNLSRQGRQRAGKDSREALVISKQ